MLTVESNVKNEIKNLQEYANLLEKVKDTEIVTLGAEDIAKAMHCSVASAREFMHRPDFPLQEVGKTLRVEKTAFFLYLQNRRVKDYDRN